MKTTVGNIQFQMFCAAVTLVNKRQRRRFLDIRTETRRMSFVAPYWIFFSFKVAFCTTFSLVSAPQKLLNFSSKFSIFRAKTARNVNWARVIVEEYVGLRENVKFCGKFMCFVLLCRKHNLSMWTHSHRAQLTHLSQQLFALSFLLRYTSDFFAHCVVFQVNNIDFCVFLISG